MKENVRKVTCPDWVKMTVKILAAQAILFVLLFIINPLTWRVRIFGG